MPLKSKIIHSVVDTYIRSTAKLEADDVKDYVESMKFLEEAFSKTNTAFMLIDYTDWSYRYVSNNCHDVIGYHASDMLQNGPRYGLEAVNIEDLKIQTEYIHPSMVEVFKKLPEARKDKFKFSFNFRYKHFGGKDLQILQTNIFLKWDNQSNPLLKLILFNDISEYKKDKSVLYFISAINEIGENEFISQKAFTADNHSLLSPRELKLLQLISQGEKQDSIAKKLDISVNTVKNHKKSILAKLGCTNSVQALALSKFYGIIS